LTLAVALLSISCYLNMLEIRLIVRAAHLLAAAAWVGGSFFYLVVALPAMRNGAAAAGGMGSIAGQMAALFKRMVTICIGVLLLSGAYLAFDRLTTTTLGWPYLSVLALKILVALCMFALAIYLGQSNIRRLAKRATRLSKAAPQLTLALGILVFVLGALLNILFETSAHP
jgi:uncharacterized membrane protein